MIYPPKYFQQDETKRLGKKLCNILDKLFNIAALMAG
jgi:hypothetical protein